MHANLIADRRGARVAPPIGRLEPGASGAGGRRIADGNERPERA